MAGVAGFEPANVRVKAANVRPLRHTPITTELEGLEPSHPLTDYSRVSSALPYQLGL